MRLSKTIGERMMHIQRRSYLMPKKNESSNSENERSEGLNAKKVANLKTVKTIKKISSRLITHSIVFGILNLISIKRATKEVFLSIEGNVPELYFNRSSIFAKCF